MRRNRLQEKYEDAKNQDEARIKALQDEYEEKINQENIQHEEELEIVQDQLSKLKEERHSTVAKLENSLTLEKQKSQTFENQLHEVRENIELVHQQNLGSMESQLNQFSSERTQLLEKIEELNWEATQKEKAISTLESRQESLENSLRERDEIIDRLDSELTETYNQNIAQKEECKKIQEEMTEIEKTKALVAQEKEYLEEKVKELDQHVCEITEEYEERVSNMKNKIKDLKMERNRNQSRDKENENRFNSPFISQDDRLEDILNMKITVIPDFFFIRVRSIESAKPSTAKSEKHDALKCFKDYDVYEIEVSDDDIESHYVIERTAHQILGLFKRLK
jgi:chromosome segregation ATPase